MTANELKRSTGGSQSRNWISHTGSDAAAIANVAVYRSFALVSGRKIKPENQCTDAQTHRLSVSSATDAE